jgi:hypothetical protein
LQLFPFCRQISLEHPVLKQSGVAINGVIVVPCTIHAFQLLLGNGIKNWMGTGETKQRNMMQLLYSCHKLEDNMSPGEWDDMVERAKMWVSHQLTG